MTNVVSNNLRLGIGIQNYSLFFEQYDSIDLTQRLYGSINYNSPITFVATSGGTVVSRRILG